MDGSDKSDAHDADSMMNVVATHKCLMVLFIFFGIESNGIVGMVENILFYMSEGVKARLGKLSKMYRFGY